jgi:hypothetical protein
MQVWFKTALGIAASVLVFVACFVAEPADAAQYPGIPSQVASRDLRATLDLGGSGLTRQLTVREYSEDKAGALRIYGLDMTKRMHWIIVSDDLTVFMHVHPVLGSDGGFRLGVRFPRAAIYHVYADAVPTGFGHSVFRFDVKIGWTKRITARRVGVAGDSVTLGPYVVRLSAVRVPAGQDAPVLVAITRSGEPATDLHPYLGAFAHIVAIGVSDLSYTHVHAMDARSMAMGIGTQNEASPVPANTIVPATMSVHLDLAKKGIYKVWVEFQGGSKLYAAPFAVTAY